MKKLGNIFLSKKISNIIFKHNIKNKEAHFKPSQTAENEKLINKKINDKIQINYSLKPYVVTVYRINIFLLLII